MNVIKIGNKFVGNNHPTYIIAEVGSNHDGSIEKAKELIKTASGCGVDAVKFQFFKADTIAADIEDEIVILENGKTLYQLYKENETPYEWVQELKNFCKIHNITFLATPFDKEAVIILEKIKVAAYKIASFEIVDYDFLDYIANKNKTIILSTGMANLEDIEAAVNIFKKHGTEFILLHCGISYPLSFKDVNFNAMLTLKEKFNCIVGYSDHTEGSLVPILGVGLGMDLIEKHFTLNKNLDGPDHNFALDPSELKTMVTNIRNAELALGKKIKDKVKAEEIHYRRGRRSLFVIKDISEGMILSVDNIASLRPGIGLHPKFLRDIIGKKVKKDISKNTPITWDIIEK